jgi:hypothetical protein
MSPAKKATKKATKKKTGKQVVLAPAKPLNIKATGKEIVRLVTAVYKHETALNTATTSLQTLLRSIALHHPKQVLQDVLAATGLAHSRTDELRAVANGRKTMDEVRAATAERQRRFKAAKKTKALPPPNPVTGNGKSTKPTTGSNGNSTDAEASAAERRAANAAADDDETDDEAADAETTETEGEPETTEAAEEETAQEAAAEKPAEKPVRSRSGKAKPPVDLSKKALAELKVALETWVPKITSSDDRRAAVAYLSNAIRLMDTKHDHLKLVSDAGNVVPLTIDDVEEADDDEVSGEERPPDSKLN